MKRLRPEDLRRARHFTRNRVEQFESEREREERLDREGKWDEPHYPEPEPLDD